MALKLQDFIDIEQFQMLQDRFNELYSFPSSLIDNEGNILTATACQDVCTKFHRQNSECEKECIKSDQYIADHLSEANPAVSYRCPHGLIDNAAPIIINGVHYGNFFTGQFFLEPPDLNFFRMQAKKYGFVEEEYIEAVKKVPIWNNEQLQSYLFFVKGLIEVISSFGLEKLKQLETKKRMQESEELAEKLLATVPDIIVRLDLNGQILFVNDFGLRIGGYADTDLIGKNMLSFIAAEDIERVLNNTALMFERRLGPQEYQLIMKDGRRLPIEANGDVLRDQDGAPYGIVHICRDITERKRMEETLRKSEENARTIMDVSGSAIVMLDRQGIILDNNNAHAALFESKREELIGKRIFDFFPANVAESRRAAVETAFRTGRPVSGQDERNGRWNNYVIHPICDGNGDVLRVAIYAQDITDHLHAEAERKKLQEQLRQFQKMESVGRLAGGVAHDFNNMLGVILGHVEIAMSKTDAGHPLCSNLEAIRRAAERSSELTKQLLAFARKQTISPKTLNLNETVDRMLSMLHRLIGENISLEWLPDSNLWNISIDPSQMDQILANLCVNARDAITGVGKVTIETGSHTLDDIYCAAHTGFVPGQYVSLTVKDDGCGMDRETMSHLFEPFFTTKAVGKGTGLGLATVYGIVKQNSGFINIESEAGRGTSVKIYLPRQIAKTEMERSEGTTGPGMRGHETILLAEDEQDVLELTAMMLNMQGYHVLAARTPGEAISMAREHVGEIHLLLTDVVMPEMNGRALAKSLLALYPNIKRLFMSGYTADVIAHHGFLEEGVNFIHKPFSLKSLSAKIRETLDQK